MHMYVCFEIPNYRLLQKISFNSLQNSRPWYYIMVTGTPNLPICFLTHLNTVIASLLGMGYTSFVRCSDVFDDTPFCLLVLGLSHTLKPGSLLVVFALEETHNIVHFSASITIPCERWR